MIGIKLNFSAIPRDCFGRPERPSLILKTKHGKIWGFLGHYFNIAGDFKFNEPSEISFDYPASVDGQPTPFYDALTKGKLVQLDPYGVFIIASATSDNDGIRNVKSCNCNSLESELADKNIVFAAGTYALYNPVDNSNTILGMVLEKALNWKIGTVAKSLWSRYRTFDQTDSNILDFLLNSSQKPYGCVFDFDTYTRTINVLDADDDVQTLPIHLSFQNLLKQVKINDVDDTYATKISVHGADGVDIRNVNPTGTNEIVNLGYSISQGDLPEELVTRYRTWKTAIRANQPYYTGLVALRNTTYSRYLTEKAHLVDMQGELASLDNLRAVNVQAKSAATQLGSATQEGTILYYEARLKEISEQYLNKQKEITNQEALLKSIEAEYNKLGEDIKAVNNELKTESYFTPDEIKILNLYFVEGNFEDSTFAVFDVDVSGDDDTFTSLSSAAVAFTDIKLVDVNTDKLTGRRIFSISGGSVSIAGGNSSVTAALVGGTLDHKDGSSVVLSLCLGAGTMGDKNFPSGNLTLTGTSSFNDDGFISKLSRKSKSDTDSDTGVSYETVWYEGGNSFTVSSCSVYFTRNVTEYQRYSVEQELYDYAEERIDEIAYPLYEFEIESGNLIYAKEFEPFKNALQLGCAVRLQLSDDITLKPILLEVHLDFEKPDNFSMVFSNQFQTKRPDKVNSLKALLEESKSTTRSFDLGKFDFGEYQNTGAANAVKRFIQEGLDAASQQIFAGKDQHITIDERGIKIATIGSKEYILMANGMIAIIDDETKESKMAMGHFYNAASGQTYYGILADVIGGNLLIGLELNITCPDVNGGVAQFKVDSTGCFLNNSRFYLQSDGGGKIGMDANYGIFGGPSSLFTVQDTGHVIPSFINADGSLNLDKYGFPVNTNFWVDIRTGNVYFRGKVYAIDGVFNGTIYARDGEFKGIVQAADFLDSAGNSMMSNGKFKSSVLDLGNIQLDGSTGDITMTGNITMGGNINLSGGKITWGNNGPVKYQFSTSITGPWNATMQTADKYRRDSLDGGITWGAGYQFRGEDGKPGANGSDADVPGYIKSTYIDMTTVQSPYIKANILQIQAPNNNSTNGLLLSGYYQNRAYDWLKISYFEGDGPQLYFSSPGGAIFDFQNKSSFDNGFTSYGTNTFSRDSTVKFEGSVQFMGSVSGITATFA